MNLAKIYLKMTLRGRCLVALKRCKHCRTLILTHVDQTLSAINHETILFIYSLN